MTEPHRQQRPSTRKLDELTLIVRPPGKPTFVKTFADDERAEAEAYAAEHGGTVDTMPPI